MKTERVVEPRCLEIRQRLPEFLRDRLGAVARGEVQGHLLSCDDCSRMYGELIFHEVDEGNLALMEPPSIPPVELYEKIARGRSNLFGDQWQKLREALRSANEQLKQQAQDRIEEIGNLLVQLIAPPPMVRVRGAVRTRGGKALSPVAAEVLSSIRKTEQRRDIREIHRLRGGENKEDLSELFAELGLLTPEPSTELARTGQKVSFTVLERPHILDGNFRIKLKTEESGYEGDSVICTLTLNKEPVISFSGIIKQAGSDWEAEIEAEGLPRATGDIPIDQVQVVIVKR